jgi:hypothetical protein
LEFSYTHAKKQAHKDPDDDMEVAMTMGAYIEYHKNGSEI